MLVAGGWTVYRRGKTVSAGGGWDELERYGGRGFRGGGRWRSQEECRRGKRRQGAGSAGAGGGIRRRAQPGGAGRGCDEV